MISFGFWAGDQNVRAPAFYAYMHPQPPGFMNESLSPEEAHWNRQEGLAMLMYDDVRYADSPEKAVLDFLESVYQAGAKKANWNIEAFRLPSPENQPGEQPEKPKEYSDILEKLERPDDRFLNLMESGEKQSQFGNLSAKDVYFLGSGVK
jgi:hypothetical protein